jgi:photosynthetic reaction center H subunit
MNLGAIAFPFDVAQVAIWLFWFFFAGLIYYLHREDKREGYPLEDKDASPRSLVEGFPAMPAPKTYLLAHGGTVSVPKEWTPGRPKLNAREISPQDGDPIIPLGNPLLAGVGPGAWADRADVPDLTYEGHPKIVPLRVDPHFGVVGRDPDPRGKKVLGADGEVGGTVVDLWVDRSEYIFRYVELEATNGRRVLVPMTFCKVARDGTVRVQAILGAQFADVPGLRHAEQITLLEEDKVCAYYGAGTLFATPERAEPFM